VSLGFKDQELSRGAHPLTEPRSSSFALTPMFAAHETSKSHETGIRSQAKQAEQGCQLSHTIYTPNPTFRLTIKPSSPTPGPEKQSRAHCQIITSTHLRIGSTNYGPKPSARQHTIPSDASSRWLQLAASSTPQTALCRRVGYAIIPRRHATASSGFLSGLEGIHPSRPVGSGGIHLPRRRCAKQPSSPWDLLGRLSSV
jgi:hypothetical protein